MRFLFLGRTMDVWGFIISVIRISFGISEISVGGAVRSVSFKQTAREIGGKATAGIAR